MAVVVLLPALLMPLCSVPPRRCWFPGRFFLLSLFFYSWGRRRLLACLLDVLGSGCHVPDELERSCLDAEGDLSPVLRGEEVRPVDVGAEVVHVGLEVSLDTCGDADSPVDVGAHPSAPPDVAGLVADPADLLAVPGDGLTQILPVEFHIPVG